MKEPVNIDRNCIFCNTPYIITVEAAELKAYQEGAMVQDAFPNLSADMREMLITRICPSCWDEEIGEEDDYYDPT